MEGSSYRGFELPGQNYKAKPGEIDFGSSKREVLVTEGLSYRVLTVNLSCLYDHWICKIKTFDFKFRYFYCKLLESFFLIGMLQFTVFVAC